MMERKHLFKIMFLAAGLIFAVTGSVEAQEDHIYEPGIVEGTGKVFEVRDSDYLDITMESSEEIKARVESIPGMIIIIIDKSEFYSSTDIFLSGLSPDYLYHKYEDDYHNYSPAESDGHGKLSFRQDTTQNHIIFLQTGKSTKYITDDATGGSCEAIGAWDNSTKTCTLEMNIREAIQIEGDNITLDGNGHSIDGPGYGNGVYLRYRKGVTIKNLRISNFSQNIYLNSSDGNFIVNNMITSPIPKNSRVKGVYLYQSRDNHLENNIISNVTGGIDLGSLGGNKMRNNAISNSRYAFSALEEDNDIDITNTVDGKIIYYLKDISDQVFDSDDNVGVFYCANCENITLRNLEIKDNYYGVLLKNTRNSSIENISVNDCRYGVYLPYSENNSLISNTFKNNNNGAVSSYENSGKNIFENNVISDNNTGIQLNRNRESMIRNNSLSFNDSAIKISDSSKNVIENNQIFENEKGIDFEYCPGENIFRDNTFSKNKYGVEGFHCGIRSNEIYHNNFIDNNNDFYSFYFLELGSEGNYWNRHDTSDEGCYDNDNNGICDSPYIFSGGKGGKDESPWTKEDGWKKSGYSSVAFLPGIQSSRLYKEHLFDEDRLWELTNRNEDVKDLYLNPDGTSIDENIYTRDIIDEAYFDNVYKKFMLSMDEMVEDGTIKEWKAMPYDWRMPLDKIVNEGIQLEGNQEYYLIKEIRRLAQNSDTGKVTIIGHSNGGLVGKELINKLKETGEEDLIDKFIMVAVPQLGTPKAIAGMLHGDQLNILGGLLLDKETARGLAENMTSAYNLLPSEKYFEYVETPVVEFDEDVSEIYDFRSIYGDDIDDYGELKKFLLGDDGERSDPDFSDTDSPNVLSENLLSGSENVHGSLDDWQAPEGMEVVQIAGWGLDTIAGIRYDDCDIPFCPDKLSNLDRELVFKEDGDKTVVVPSAISTNDVERYYVDLDEHNEGLKRNRDHHNILEIESLQIFIKNIIEGKRDMPKYILDYAPISKDEEKRLRYSMHSPVKVDLYDGEGSHTGIVENDDFDSDLVFYEEKIPNSYYIEFGETKYLGSDGEFPVNIELTGEDLGTFTFKIDEVYGSGEIDSTVFRDIPVMEGTKAYLEIEDEIGIMELDIEGDGEIDFEIDPGEEENNVINIEILRKILEKMELHKAVRDCLINKLDSIEKQIEKGNTKPADAMLESLELQIKNFSSNGPTGKFKIDESDAEKLIKIVEIIRNNLIK